MSKVIIIMQQQQRQATTTMKFGHQVTNPGTRDPTVLASLYATLHDISDGRMVMGIGRGDSAVRYIGRQPVKVAEFERDQISERTTASPAKEAVNGTVDDGRLECHQPVAP